MATLITVRACLCHGVCVYGISHRVIHCAETTHFSLKGEKTHRNVNLKVRALDARTSVSVKALPVALNIYREHVRRIRKAMRALQHQASGGLRRFKTPYKKKRETPAKKKGGEGNVR